MFKVGDRIRIIGTADDFFFGFGTVVEIELKSTSRMKKGAAVSAQILVQFDGFELPIWFPYTALILADNGIRRAQKCLKQNSE